MLCHALGSHPCLHGSRVPVRGAGGPGAESSALVALYRDQTRSKAYVLNNYIVVIKSFILLKYFGAKSLESKSGAWDQFIFKCNSNEKCSLRPIQSY